MLPQIAPSPILYQLCTLTSHPQRAFLKCYWALISEQCFGVVEKVCEELELVAEAEAGGSAVVGGASPAEFEVEGCTVLMVFHNSGDSVDTLQYFLIYSHWHLSLCICSSC